MPLHFRCALILMLWSPACFASDLGAYFASKSGIEAYQKRDYSRAATDFMRAAEHLPDRYESFFNLGDAYFQANQFKEAAVAYEQALAHVPAEHQLPVLYNLGNTYYRLGKTSQAIDAYRSALTLDPSHSDSKFNLELALRQSRHQPSAPDASSASHSKQESRPKTDSSTMQRILSTLDEKERHVRQRYINPHRQYQGSQEIGW